MRVLFFGWLVGTFGWGLAFGEIQSIPVADGKLAVEVAGSGPPVVFLHGAFLDQRSWDRQMPAFAKRFRAVRYDIRPYGRSSRVASPYSPSQDLLQVLDHLQIERAHLVGHSFGCMIALEFALLHPERVDRLVLAGGTPAGFALPQNETRQAMAVFEAVKQGDDATLAAWLALSLWDAARERPALLSEIESMARTNLDVFKMSAPPFVWQALPNPERLASVRAPTLVLVGERDTPGLQEASRALADGIPGAKRVQIPGADHALPLGWQRAFNRAAVGFLTRR